MPRDLPTRDRRGGESQPNEEVAPDELYDKLKPFKERVAGDIKEKGSAPSDMDHIRRVLPRLLARSAALP